VVSNVSFILFTYTKKQQLGTGIILKCLVIAVNRRFTAATKIATKKLLAVNRRINSIDSSVHFFWGAAAPSPPDPPLNVKLTQT